jgi:Flp pilus assembly protein TadG
MKMQTRFFSRNSIRRRGAAMVYVMIIIPAAFAFCALGVDAGHCILVKNQLQNAADAAALAGALKMGTSMNAAIAAATTSAASNKANGTPVVLVSSTDIQFLHWVSKSNYTVVSAGNYATANAIRVTTRRAASAGTAVSMFFGGMVGIGSSDVTATTVATYSGGTTTSISVPGTSDLWLAGMPAGTTANFVNEVSPVDGHAPWTDSAPGESPAQVTGMTLTPGSSIQMQFSGSVSNWSGANSYGPDGDPNWASDNWYAGMNGGSEHGIADLNAPLAAIVGVFLDNNAPNTEGPAPSSLDFSTAASQDYSSLSPQLRQPFFIGDGLRADGVTPQNIVVPTGATRLYIGLMDFQEWSDNSGVGTTTVTKPVSVKIVQ